MSALIESKTAPAGTRRCLLLDGGGGGSGGVGSRQAAAKWGPSERARSRECSIRRKRFPGAGFPG